MAETVLEVQELSAGYGGPPIIVDVNLKARAHEITVIVGLNGAGKSTLLRAVAGVLQVTKGRVLLGGEDVTGKASEALLRAGISYVPQTDNVFPSLSVRENLEMGGYILRSRSQLKAKIEEVCHLFPDLNAALRRPARTLSGGQRLMLAVARGLMVKPTLLLLDEPTAGLAPKVEGVVWESIEAIRQSGVALLVVDQNVRRALSHADWAYVMSLGRVRPYRTLILTDRLYTVAPASPTQPGGYV